MPTIIDAFEDTFTNTFLARQIDEVPFRPMQVGEMLQGQITAEFPPTNTIQVDVNPGRIGVLSTKAEDADPQTIKPSPLASAIPIGAVNIPARATIYASQINGKRRPGEAQLKTIARTVNERLADMNQDFDLTFEMHRIGMLKGKVLDADGTTELFNYFNLLNKSQQTVDFPFSTDSTDVNGLTREVMDKIDDALGAIPYDSIAVVAGRNWYDAMVDHPKVRDTFLNHNAASRLRGEMSTGFAFGSFDDIRRYRDTSAATLPDKIGADEAFAVPMGVSNMFRVFWTPQNRFDTVNDRGRRVLVTRRPDRDHGRFVEMMGESRPIWLNTYPDAVIRLTKS